MDLDLTGQNAERATIAPKLLRLKQLMDERTAIWARLSVEKRRLWVQHAAEKDPIMDLAVDIYRYLKTNFAFEELLD